MNSKKNYHVTLLAVALLILAILLSVEAYSLIGEKNMSQTITKYIQSDDADGWCEDDSSFGYLEGDTGIIIGDWYGSSFDAFLYFPNIQIPRGAKILSAKVTFVAEESLSGTTVNVTIAGENDGNPSKPTTCGEMSGNDTAQTVAWDNIGAWTGGNTYDSPDITDIIQEIADRTDWASGNAMLLYFRDNGSSARRDFEGYGGTSYNPALLTIEYEVGGIQSVMLGANF